MTTTSPKLQELGIQDFFVIPELGELFVVPEKGNPPSFFMRLIDPLGVMSFMKKFTEDPASYLDPLGVFRELSQDPSLLLRSATSGLKDCGARAQICAIMVNEGIDGTRRDPANGALA
ncbi:MAG: hypothetical protein N4A36_03075 [Candidatus Gracilibacteria bacterium]|jgi:hypothetical protein|nr:hypothetical protein [Candidatus Gracilibacteria bacterium]